MPQPPRDTPPALCTRCRGAVTSCPGGMRPDCPVAAQSLTGPDSRDPLAAPTLDGRPRPLRIVQVVNVRWFNATAWYGLFLSRLLRDAGHEVRVLALPGTESFAKAEEWGLSPTPLPLNSSNPFTLARLAASLAALLREFRPHVVNCHRGESFLLWSTLKAAGYPFALVRTRGDQRPPKANAVNRHLHASADALVATNSRTAREFSDLLQVPHKRIHTIFGGVDTARFFPDPQAGAKTRAAWGLAEHERAVGILGRFDTVKGQKELIATVAALRAEGRSNLRLVLAGFPTVAVSQEQVQAWLTEAGIADSAIITGKTPDVRGCVNALDLGVVASLGSETIARAALEIMACGVPLISSDVGVMPDLLDADALFPPADVPALAAAIRRFLDEPGRGPDLVRRQRERMRGLSEQEFLSQTLAVYYGTLSKPSKR